MPAALAPTAARAVALELLGAHTAGLDARERGECLDRVVRDLQTPDEVRGVLQALAEYAATFADLAAELMAGSPGYADSAQLVRALARVDLLEG